MVVSRTRRGERDMRKTRGVAGFTLIELLIVIIIIGILAAIAIPMFLGQRDKAKEAAVKGGVHNIELGIASYAVDHNDVYPASGSVNKGSMVDVSGVSYVDNWPQNPWTGANMTEGATEGNYAYTLTSTEFTLVGFGHNGDPIITAP
jgi:type IV pilus assembly protein PilA